MHFVLGPLLALAGTDSLPADLTDVQVSDDEAVVFVVQRDDGYVWPLKAPIKLAVDEPMAAKVKLAPGVGVPLVVLRSDME